MISEKLIFELNNYYVRSTGSDLLTLLADNIIKRPFSTVVFLRAVTSTKTYRLVMKKTVHNPINKGVIGSENQAVVEYNILEYLYEMFELVEGCKVPRPVLVIPESEIFVMELVEGTNLMDKFRYSTYFQSLHKFDSLKRDCFLSGFWLKNFQKITGILVAGRETLDTTLERCEYRLKKLQDGNYPQWPKDFGTRVMKYLQKLESECSNKEIMTTGRHGDFGPWNIISGDHGITVIDFLGYKMDLIPLDFLKMKIYLEDSLMELTTDPRRIEILRRSFEDGYGEIPLVDDSIVKLCEILHRICSIYGSITNIGGRFHHRMERRRILNVNMKWLNNLEKWQPKLWAGENYRSVGSNIA